MAPPKKSTLPKPLPEGFILTDTEKKRWRLGKILSQGGFGLIYLASRDVDRPVAADTDFVIKVEYQENGPLFSELKFYQRAAKAESMEKWKRSRKLDFLGIPTYWGTGQAEHNDLRYRFMAMDRLGSDLQKVCENNGGRLKKDTVLRLGQGLVTVLEYIHDNEYVHADIKAANLMLGYRDPEQVYLADYGLAYRYCPDGIHKEYKENPKKGHNGTIEYTSLDAHKGLAPSRRGDLQILGFCLLHWLCGSLPWDKVLKYPDQVQEAKARLMDNLPGSVQQLSVSGGSTDEVAAFLLHVKTLGYEEKPDYERFRKLLATKGTGRLDFSVPQGFAGGSTSTNVQDPPTEEKKVGRPRGRPKANVVAREEEEEGEKKSGFIREPPRTKPPVQSKAGRPRGRPKAKAVAREEEEDDDDDDEVRKKAKPNTPSRGRTPRTKPSSGQMEEEVFPAVGRSLRPRNVVTYEDYCSAEEEEEEEEDRPRPVDPRYVRGPPLSPRAQSKQTTRSKWTRTKMDDLCVTSGRQKQKPYLETRATYKLAHCGIRDQRHILDNREGCDAGMLHHRADFHNRQWLDDDCGYKHYGNGFDEWDTRSIAPEQEVHPVQKAGLLDWVGYVSFLLLLGVALGVCQSVLYPV